MCRSNKRSRLSTESARLRGEEGASELLRLSTVLAVGQSELQVLVRVHHVLVSLQVLVVHHSRLDDLDRTVTSTVRSSHLLVALLHGAQKGHITVLLVHVVGSRARVVTQPNTEVLHLRSRLVDLPLTHAPHTHLVHSQNLSGSVLHLLQSVHEVPVAGLGGHSVRSEQSHSVDLGLGIVLRRKSTTNNVIVVNLYKGENRYFQNHTSHHILTGISI